MKSDSLLLALGYCLAFASLLVILELVVRKWRLSSDVSRRLAHIASGLFSLLMWSKFNPTVFYICGSALLLLISVSYIKRILTSVHNVARKTYGEQALPIGILLTYALAANRPAVFVPAILIMTLADSCAGIVGDLRQKQRPSRIGSLVFFGITVSILTMWGYTPLTTIAIAFVISAVERISPFGTDNATVPIATSVLLLL